MRRKKRNLWPLWYTLFMFACAAIGWFSAVWSGHRTVQYQAVGFKDGEKVERVVTLTRNYRYGPWLHIYHGERNVGRAIGNDGQIYHRVYYTNPTHNDTICGFDTICELTRL